MQYVLVTGAYGGMGKAVTDELVKEGFGVFALDKAVGSPKESVFPVQADITDAVSIENAYKAVTEVTNELYAVVHLAGTYTLNSLVEISEKDFTKIFDVNVFGAYRINKVFTPLIKRNGRIVITTSELAPLDPLPFTGLYAITKSALDKYAFSLAMEMQLLDVSVSVLRPGAVDTGMLDVSTTALDSFCKNTKLYKCNATKFKNVVDGVESKKIAPQKIAKKIAKILKSKRPKSVYSINRNPLLRLLNVLPIRMQRCAIRKILK